MISPEAFKQALLQIIDAALAEDIGSGDYSSLACVPMGAIGKAKLLVKDQGIIAGVEFAKMIIERVDAGLKVEVLIPDGSSVTYGDVVFTVEGSSQSILKAERLVLNSMQRMCGIASLTNTYVQKLKPYKTQILEQQKNGL